MILQGYLFSVLYALLCLLLAFVAYKLGTTKKITRKIVHILVGFEWVILYTFMGPSVHFLAVCILFLLILAISYKGNLLPMISSDGDNSPGTVYYAVAMTIMAVITLFIPQMILPFGIGVFCTSAGDGLAGVVGQVMNFPKNVRIYKNKTIYGSLTNFIVSFIVVGIFNAHYSLGLSILHILSISLLSVELELFTGRGLDNISITLGTSLLTYSFINFDSTENYIVPVLLTPAIIAFASSKRALTVDGIIAAILLDLAVSVSLGNFGFTLLFSFFALGIIADKIKKHYKKTKQNIEKRGDCRNYVQVLSNGIVAAICALLYVFTRNYGFVLGFIAALAEALADTLASGVGSISGRAYDLFRFKPCQPGLSGGMSLIGTVFSLIGGIIVSIVAYIFGRITFVEIIIVSACAFLGALFDSMLGSLLQVKYKCTKCGSIIEAEHHCGAISEHYSGLKFINNDMVNFFGTLLAALIAFAISYAI